MTTISSSSAALSILQQTSSLADPKNQSAADTILDIVSGRTGKVSKVANDALDSAIKASAEAKNRGKPAARSPRSSRKRR